MCHVVRCQDGQVIRPQILPVSDLDRVTETFWYGRKKRIEPGDEITSTGECRFVERTEFKDQRTDAIPIRLQARREVLFERGRVQIMFIGKPSPTSVTGVLRPNRDCAVFRDLEAEDESAWDGVE
jgi:hypothetical protein